MEGGEGKRYGEEVSGGGRGGEGKRYGEEVRGGGSGGSEEDE